MYDLKDFNISHAEFYADAELRQVITRVHGTILRSYYRRSLDARINLELQRRAQCGCFNEQMALEMAESRNKLMFQNDYEAYKNGTYSA